MNQVSIKKNKNNWLSSSHEKIDSSNNTLDQSHYIEAECSSNDFVAF